MLISTQKPLPYLIVWLAFLTSVLLGCSAKRVNEPTPSSITQDSIEEASSDFDTPFAPTQHLTQARDTQSPENRENLLPEGAIRTSHRSINAQFTNAHCVIRGASDTIRFDGGCVFEQFDGNGSFFIEVPSGLIDGYMSISVAIIEPGIAEVRGLTPDGINSRWGEAQRSTVDAACWAGSDFTICAY
jgi:hypothetical protein